MNRTSSSDSLVRGIDDVLITAELANRPSRIPDYETENRALGLLAQEMATNPRGVLQKCTELVMELCHADSAGISILEPGGTSGLLRWHAAAGGFAANLHGTMPREASPCGTVMERNCVLLFHEAERFFPTLRGIEPRIYENLLAPWHVEGKAVGTLWAIRHNPEGRFDAEDARLLQSLARFAAAAFQMTSALDEATAERSALRASERQLRDILDSLSEGYALFDAAFTILDVNAETLRLDGRTRDELVGRNHWEAFPGSEDSPQGDMFKRVMRDRIPEAMEHSYRWPDGKTMWVDTRAYPTTHGNIAIQWRDITDHKQARDKHRETEERHACLLKLSDALRAEPSPDAIADRGLGILSEHLQLDRCYIGIYRPIEDRADLTHQVGNERVPPLPPSIRLSDFPSALRIAVEGTLVIEDFEETAGLSEADRRNIGGLGLRALVAATLRRGEHNPLWATVAVSSEVRRWTRNEITLLEEAAERIWAAMERARAEAAVRESEARFAQFAASSSDILWIRDVETLELEFVSAAARDIYGVAPETLLGDPKPGMAMIVPDDRQDAFDNIVRVRNGAAVVHDYRIQRADGTFRWMRSAGFPLFDVTGQVDKIGGISSDITEAKLDAEHSAVLLAELQHRVRNTMALLRSITNRTAERAESVPEYRDLMEGRLLAFARVQALLTRAANLSVGIRSIVQDEVSVQAGNESQYVLDGPGIALSPKAAEVLTLAIHELVTNAVKYGALSVPSGKVTVRWSTFERRGDSWLAFDWTEEGADARPQPTSDASRRRGFGSELIEGRIPYELGGRGQLAIEPGGARCYLEFPLQEGASILETGGPQRAIVFGGSIDMTGEPDLTGRRVLVVEDDYYLATDTARALRGAGVEVLGPCATEEDARAELAEQRPDVVVVDINLGLGPSFKLAEALKDYGIPFVFTTGYDAEVIPIEFDGVDRLQKPLQLRQIVRAVAKLTADA